jgi:hypothetical protein
MGNLGLVWSAETNIPMQNSWAAFTYGDGTMTEEWKSFGAGTI